MFLLQLYNTDPVFAIVGGGGQGFFLSDPCLLLFHLQVEYLHSERFLLERGWSGRGGENGGRQEGGRMKGNNWKSGKKIGRRGERTREERKRMRGEEGLEGVWEERWNGCGKEMEGKKRRRRRRGKVGGK